MTALAAYTQIGMVEMVSENDRDQVTVGAAYAKDGQVYFLETTGCACCGDEWDGVTAEDLVPVASNQDLWGKFTEVYRGVFGFAADGEDTEEAAWDAQEEIAALLKVSARYFA